MCYFDIEKKTHVYVDAGPVGLGAILFQGESESDYQVVAYGSRTLTDTEQRYSQIEKEMQSISWALQHFHIYLYGSNFYVHTDHKPLVYILWNPRSTSSARIERLCLKIQQYSFTILHQKGVNNPADYLSRHPNTRPDVFALGIKVDRYVNFVLQHSVPKSISIDEVRKATLDLSYCDKINRNQSTHSIRCKTVPKYRARTDDT